MIQFEWDPQKARSNQRKHGVSFGDAIRVFDDPHALFYPNFIDETGEQRWQAIGSTGAIAVLLVVHTVRDEGELIRLISARPATREERKRYEKTRTNDCG